jgi:hypothetical protein
VSKVELQDTLAFLRKRLDRWIIETEDLGEFPEIELIKKWFPEGKPKTISPLKSTINNNKIYLSHLDQATSIVWKEEKDSIWSIYTEPLDFNKTIQAKGVRIGYKDSSLSTFFLK